MNPTSVDLASGDRAAPVSEHTPGAQSHTAQCFQQLLCLGGETRGAGPGFSTRLLFRGSPPSLLTDAIAGIHLLITVY